MKLGLSALKGEKGPAYDRIVFNAALIDHLLSSEGAEDPKLAIERAKEAVDSGEAFKRLEKYVERSNDFVRRLN